MTHDSNLLLLLPKNPTRLEIRARTLSNLFDMKKLNEKAGLGLSEFSRFMQPGTDILRSISEIFLQEGTMA